MMCDYGPEVGINVALLMSLQNTRIGIVPEMTIKMKKHMLSFLAL